MPGGGEGRVRGRAGGSGSVISGEWRGMVPPLQAASEGVMVMVQPGLSFSSCRSRQARRCPGDSRLA